MKAELGVESKCATVGQRGAYRAINDEKEVQKGVYPNLQSFQNDYFFCKCRQFQTIIAEKCYCSYCKAGIVRLGNTTLTLHICPKYQFYNNKKNEIYKMG